MRSLFLCPKIRLNNNLLHDISLSSFYLHHTKHPTIEENPIFLQ